jgi:hypothetical protein
MVFDVAQTFAEHGKLSPVSNESEAARDSRQNQVASPAELLL